MAKVGRKSRYEEFQRGNLLALTTNWLIESWPTFTKDEKMKIALVIAPKGIVEKHQHSGELKTSFVVSCGNQDRPNKEAV